MINRNLYLQIATPVLVLFLGIFALWFFLLKPISSIGQEYKNNRLILAEVEQKAGLGGKLKKEFEKVKDQSLVKFSQLSPTVGQSRVVIVHIDDFYRISRGKYENGAIFSVNAETENAQMSRFQ